MNYIESQFGNPKGIIGHLVGIVMAYENRARNQWALSLLDIQPTDRILEIGFGPGWAIHQASKLAYQGLVAGVDRSSAMVKQARLRNRAKVKLGQVILRHGSAAEIPFEDETFNKIYAVNSFHEWENINDGLKEARRVLVLGGMLLIVEHPHGGLGETSLKALGNQLREQISSQGFQSVKIFSNSIQGRPAIGVQGVK